MAKKYETGWRRDARVFSDTGLTNCVYRLEWGTRASFRTLSLAQKAAKRKAKKSGEAVAIYKYCTTPKSRKRGEWAGEPRVVSRCGKKACSRG